QLEGLSALPPKTLERNGKALLEVIATAMASSGPALARIEELTPAQTALVKKLQAAVQEIAVKVGIPASYLASRSDLGKLLRDGAQADLALLQGWRREVAGDELLRLLPGR